MAQEGVYNLLGQRESQRQELDSLENLADKLDLDKQGWVLLRDATFFDSIGNYSLATTKANSSIEYALKTGDRNLEVEALHRLGASLCGISKFSEARVQVEHALSLAKDLGMGRIEASCLTLLAIIVDNEDHTGYRSYTEQALKVSQGIGDSRMEAIACSNLASSYILAYPVDLNQAQDYINRAICITQDIGARIYEGYPLFQSGQVSFVRGDFPGSLHFFAQSLHIAQETEDKHLEHGAACQLGKVNILLGNFVEAFQYQDQGLRTYEVTKQPFDQAYSLNEIALIHVSLGNFQKAMILNDEVLQVSAEIKDRDLEGKARLCRGRLLNNLKDFTRAYTEAEWARSLHHNWDCYEEANSLIVLAEAFAGQGHFANAADTIQQAEAIWRQYGAKGRIIETQAVLASIHLEQGEKLEALADIHEIIADFTKDGCFKGAWEPVKIYLTAYQVLQANNDPRAKDFLKAGYDLIQERAARIDEESLRRSYLENVPYNREIVRLWERRE
jgi:tetratricopeptide (TPR) repeat protein